MKKIYLFTIIAIFLISFASASISLDKGPQDLYNLKDKIELTIKIIPEIEFDNSLSLILSCDGQETEIYKEYLLLNQETSKEIMIPLIKEFIGELMGECEIKSSVGGDTEILSDKFKISNLIKVNIRDQSNSIRPGELVTFEGVALRENGKNVEGTVEVKISFENNEILAKEQVIEGNFQITIAIPEKIKAGQQNIEINVYETNSKGQITNKGQLYSDITIKQIPTNIEVVLEEKEIIPGESLKVKILLHDQTGEKMDSYAYIAIKNENQEIVERIEQETGITFEYPIKYNQAPSTWSIASSAEDIINNAEFVIIPHEKINIEAINNTLILTNQGNVPYNETVEVFIGNDSINLPVYLELDEKQRFKLSAPRGEYDIKVGETTMRVSLTGHAINIKKMSETTIRDYKTFIWVFVILILGIFAFTIFRKNRKKTFFGKRKEKPVELKTKKKMNSENLINPQIKTELSLSIKGSKQNATIGCLSLKNYHDIQTGEGNVGETLQKIVEIIESKKGIIYQNKGHLFYILAPIKTKTFKNEIIGVGISDKIKKILKEHNKKFKKIIEFGISLNYGTIVTKEDAHGFKFMTMGTLMTTAKKLASHSKEEIYLGEKIKARLGQDIKTEFKRIGESGIHMFKEIVDRTKHSTFLSGFVERQRKERLKEGKK